MDQNTQQRIDDLVKQNDVVLFMKGNASFPMCGFSGRAIQILKACGVEPRALTTVNVLEDEAVRQGIKEYSKWPTIPQLYVKGEFIGGSDIMMEMYESGELQQLVAGQGRSSLSPQKKRTPRRPFFIVDRGREAQRSSAQLTCAAPLRRDAKRHWSPPCPRFRQASPVPCGLPGCRRPPGPLAPPARGSSTVPHWRQHCRSDR